MPLKIAAFPKCYIDQIAGSRTMSVFDWVKILPVAREHDVVLGLENHDKDGFWKYPEFAQKQDAFLALLDAIPERTHFGGRHSRAHPFRCAVRPVQRHRGRRRPD